MGSAVPGNLPHHCLVLLESSVMRSHFAHMLTRFTSADDRGGQLEVAGVDALIEKRAAERAKANEEAQRERAQDNHRRGKLREANRQAWLRHHMQLAECHALISAAHERRA